MNRNELEKYLGKQVQIKLFDDRVITGYLRKSGEEAFKNNPNLYLPQKYYFLTKNMQSTVSETVLFRVSHIKSLRTKFFKRL